MDITYLLFLQKLRLATHGAFDDFARHIGDFGDFLIPMFIVCLVYWCLNKSKGKIVLLAFLLSNLFTQMIKLQACIYRPFLKCKLLQPVKTSSGYSMPSAHSANATALYLSMANQFREIPTIKYVCFALIPLIMFSRNWIGVHTPQDVLCGFLVGAVSCIFAVKLSKKIESKKNFDWLLLFISIILTYGALSYFTKKPYPMDTNEAGELLVAIPKVFKGLYRALGTLVGYTLGIILEKRFVNFTVPEKLSKKLSVLFLGFLIFLFIAFTIPDLLAIFMTKNMACFIGNIIEMLHITFLFPIIIKKHFN